MFGSRKAYLNYFELAIPKTLYLDWQRCFIFHRLSLEARKQNDRSPVWLDGERITAAAASSIDKTNILVDRGEMSFDLFEFDPKGIEKILQTDETGTRKDKSAVNSPRDKVPPRIPDRLYAEFSPDRGRVDRGAQPAKHSGLCG